jgi:hypothetical protein
MTLPISGQISFSNINTELGRISTDEISLANAETGIYVPINQNSPSRPNGNAPYAISEFYGYNNQALPGFPVTDGLLLALDAGDSNSYPGAGTLWTNLFPGNNGTLTNGPTFNGGNQGSIVFDGIDDYVDCGIISNAPNGTADRTIQVWVMDTSVNDYSVLASYSGYGDDFTFNPPGDGRLFMLAIGGSQFNNRSLLVWTNSLNHISPFTITRNQWTNVAVTVTPGPTITLYKNGVSDGGSVKAIDTSNTQPYTVGYSNQFYSALNGRVAINGFYNRALSNTEILQNFNATRGRFGI